MNSKENDSISTFASFYKTLRYLYEYRPNGNKIHFFIPFLLNFVNILRHVFARMNGQQSANDFLLRLIVLTVIFAIITWSIVFFIAMIAEGFLFQANQKRILRRLSPDIEKWGLVPEDDLLATLDRYISRCVKNNEQNWEILELFKDYIAEIESLKVATQYAVPFIVEAIIQIIILFY